MTRLGIRYLAGRSVATNVATPREPEWPPHPGRIFMAMAATYFETRGDEQERDALEWLEQAGAPALKASHHQPRSFFETYVPVNDKLDPGSGASLRARQPRCFPTARPERDCVYLIWNSDVPQPLRGPLERLCDKVTRIGHSSSLVQMWLAEDVETLDANWQPGELASERRMRIAEPGTLGYLQRAFNQEAIKEYQRLREALEGAKGKQKNKLKEELADRFPEGQPRARRPRLARWQGYTRQNGRPPEGGPQWGPFDPNIIVLARKDEQRVLGLESTLQLTSALRDAAMRAAGEDVPEWLSGHQPSGSPTTKPHAAFFPLPFVGAKYADGHLMGLAIAVPRDLDVRGLRQVIGPLLFRDNGEERTIRLRRSDVWEWKLEREKREWPPVTLRAKTWTGPVRRWASVTPVVLHHYPKRNREGDVQRILLEAFDSARLPKPAQMDVQPVSSFEGAGHARSMPEFTDGGANLCRYQVHVVVEFPSPVEGPVLVGRGRYRGYGLLRPVEVNRG
jgi:CRISPR-associated protein Csb2